MAKGDFNKKLQDWMYGRNGPDDIVRVCANIALVIVVVDLLLQVLFHIDVHWVTYIALALIAYAWWRLASKNVAARARENEAFMSKLGPARPWVSSPSATLQEHRKFKRLTCPSCGQKARVPRGTGTVRVTCRRCHTKFEGKA